MGEFKVKKGLIVTGSGSTIFDVQGSQGQLFSVTDSLIGELFSVNDISGIPILTVSSDDTVNIGTYGAEAIKVNGSNTTLGGTFQNSSIWINNGVNNNGYNENIRLFNAPNGISVIAFGATGVSGPPQSSILGYSDRLEFRIGTSGNPSQKMFDTNVEAMGSYRAPIFYDSNNTGYYLDPASTSNLGGLTLAANVSTGRGAYGSGTANLVLLSESTYGRATIDFRSGSNYPSDGAQIYYETATNLTSGEISRLVIRTENDADDSILIRGGFIIINSTTTDGGSSTPGFQTQFNGSARLYTYSDHTAEAGSFRAPIFYDSNNTGYYLDPASTSNLNGLTVAGTITGSVNGSAASATYLNSSNYINRVGSSGNYNTDFQNTPAGTVRHQGDDANITNSPGATWWFVDNYRHSNGSNYWGTQVAWGWEDNANRLATRNVIGGSFGSWVYYLNSANYSSYSNFGGNSVYGGVFYDGNNTAYYFDGSSTGDSIRVAGDIVAYYSDERLKDRKGNIENALEKVLSLNGFYYEPNEKAQEFGYTKKLEVGVSAQEVEAILPEIIKDAPIGQGYKTLDYGRLTPILIEAIKEQNKEVQALKTEIDELKALVNQLIQNNK